MAKKKYYQSAKDRRDESRGMKKYEARMRKDSRDESKGMDEYEHRKMRRRFEDEGMIHEDKSAMANLPQDVKMKPYPKFGYGLNEYLNDTISGVDGQIYDDMSGMKKHLSKEKY